MCISAFSSSFIFQDLEIFLASLGNIIEHTFASARYPFLQNPGNRLSFYIGEVALHRGS